LILTIKKRGIRTTLQSRLNPQLPISLPTYPLHPITLNMPDWFSKDSSEAQAHAEVTDTTTHKAKISHELLVSAASFAAAHAYEKHVEKEGKPVNHAKAVELAATLAGGFIDHIFETKGLDAIDREKAKHDAKQKTEAKLANKGEL